MKNSIISFIIPICFVAVLPFLNLSGEDSKVKDETSKIKKERQQPAKNKKSHHLMGKIMQALTPEEKSALRELQKTDQKAYHQKIKGLVKKYRNVNIKRQQKFRWLIKEYHAADDNQKKEELIDKITEIVRRQFKEKIEANRKNYEKAVKRLEALKTKLEEREEKTEQIIQERVDNLTQDPVAW